NWFDVSNTAAPGQMPESVKYSFYWGGVVVLVAVRWTVARTKEYSPEQLAACEKQSAQPTTSKLVDINFNKGAISFVVRG
ncbi:MFS transporter, partial [Pseudoalteromonas sp. SIMBA_148]